MSNEDYQVLPAEIEADAKRQLISLSNCTDCTRESWYFFKKLGATRNIGFASLITLLLFIVRDLKASLLYSISLHVPEAHVLYFITHDYFMQSRTTHYTTRNPLHLHLFLACCNIRDFRPKNNIAWLCLQLWWDYKPDWICSFDLIGFILVSYRLLSLKAA